jgi:pimeloyl-ACP methyl ester carboxylesterase
MVQNEPYKSWIDTEKVGILGWSMGGMASAANAANKAATDALNIKAAVAMMPAAWWGGPITIPTFFISGDLDEWTPWQNVRRMFELTEEAPKVYLQMKDAPHWIPSLSYYDYPESILWPDGWNSPITLWILNYFNCHLHDSTTDCTAIYGTESTSLCFSSLVHKTSCEAHE